MYIDIKKFRILGFLHCLFSWCTTFLQFIYDELAHRNDEIDDLSHLNKRKQDEVNNELKADKERKARMAREKREKVMAQMSQMQKSFIKKYENFLSLEDDKDRLVFVAFVLF